MRKKSQISRNNSNVLLSAYQCFIEYYWYPYSRDERDWS